MILTIIWLGLMLFLPHFQIIELKIIGLKTINQNEAESFVQQGWLEGRRWLIFPANNYFIVNADEIHRQMTEKYLFESLTVEKIFPRLLQITAEEKISQVIYGDGNGYFLLDRQGTALNQLFPPTTESLAAFATSSDEILMTTETTEATSTVSTSTAPTLSAADWQWLKNQLPGLPIILDARRPTIQIKQSSVLSPAIIAAAIDWQAAMEKQGIGRIKHFEIGNPAAGFKIFTDRGWYLLAKPAEVENQMNNLKIILRENKPSAYIDLRYGERVFWK